MENIKTLTLFIVLAPLVGSIISGLFRNQIGRFNSHRVAVLGVLISFVLSLIVANLVIFQGATVLNENLYTWASSGALKTFEFHMGFLIDPLTCFMLVTVNFVSLLVHIYTIGYMADDDGYARFFSYISLFTFFMLMLVTANNFLQLFFGWEGVGLVSYLLIGFWFKRETAIAGNLKAFLVNRVGDFGFILGIAVIFAYTGSLDYATVFTKVGSLIPQTISIFPGHDWSVISFACLLLFTGAMGKSAQVPLHVWLPESMEGPTPISALIHAATMVTAGVFMVARMSPLYEYSDVVLSFILVIGATGALFMGLLAVVQHDIKRVIAYSTLSQLGYMMVAQGTSSYAIGIFHLMTHACFKAVLFLAAGSVIIAMHHEHDMRKMGNLKKYMPITWITFLVGSLSMVAIPPLSGFYSKDLIIEAAHLTTIPGAHYAYWCVAIGAFFTALYSFRAYFMTFHGSERMDEHTRQHLKESPWTVWLPLVLLAIPSIFLGLYLVEPLLFSAKGLLGNSVFVLEKHNVVGQIGHHFHGVWAMARGSVEELPFWFGMAGILAAVVGYIIKPELPEKIALRLGVVYKILINKYGFDDLYDVVFVKGTRRIGEIFFNVGDSTMIDGFAVNGLGNSVRRFSNLARHSQTGYLFHYTSAMVAGLLLLLAWVLLG